MTAAFQHARNGKTGHVETVNHAGKALISSLKLRCFIFQPQLFAALPCLERPFHDPNASPCSSENINPNHVNLAGGGLDLWCRTLCSLLANDTAQELV
jgi:hypothetical protein